MEWISFEDVKKAVTLAMVIERYGWQLRTVGEHVLRGKCPLPAHSSEDSKESFIATFNKGVGGAWSCHSKSCVQARGGKKGGNALDLVAAVEGCSIRDAARMMQQWFSVASPNGTPRAQEPPAAKPAREEPKAQRVSEEKRAGESDEPNAPLNFSLKGVDPLHPYLRERGISEETAHTFGVGFFPGRGSMSGRLVVPIHNRDGQLVAYAGRSIDATEPRYKFPAGFRKSLEVFNLHRLAGEISVVGVEGFFDCMKITQAGFPCVALMGAAMSAAQEGLIAGQFGHVVLMLDGDAAGREATEEIADRLQGSIYQVETVALPDGVQPDQLTGEEIRDALAAIW